MSQLEGVGRVGWRPTPPQYLLDAYPGAALAFSMRRLNSAYTGPAIRIRRASDNAEMDINFTDPSQVVVTNTNTITSYATGQLKDGVSESEIINFCGNSNGFIVRIYDQSGNGNHLNQTVAANQFKLYWNASMGAGYEKWLWMSKANSGGLTGKLPFASGTYNLNNGVPTDNNWTAFSITIGTNITSRLSAGTSTTYNTMTGHSFIDGGWRAGSKTKYVRSNGQYSAGGTDPLIVPLYGKPCMYTTLNSNDNMSLRINDNNINLTSVLSSSNSGIFDQILGGLNYELILFNSDKSSVRTDIENSILSYYSTSWTSFKG